MRVGWMICTSLFALASLALTAAGAMRNSFRLALGGGLCFSLALTGALALGIDGRILLLFGLILMGATRLGRKERKT